VIGNQLDNTGAGAAIGAGFGAANGMLTGIGLDMAEGTELEQQRELDALKVQVAANQRNLMALQDSLDARDSKLTRTSGGVAQVFFDKDRASIRLGTAQQLERVADEIKRNPYVGRVELHGHSDNTGDTELNKRLSEARARTVATFLANQGISTDQIAIVPHGAEKPLASNDSEAGRQLNRRVEIVLGR
jgi:outer membrane protein OmpA-like peptidoglycan-associated protein